MSRELWVSGKLIRYQTSYYIADLLSGKEKDGMRFAVWAQVPGDKGEIAAAAVFSGDDESAFMRVKSDLWMAACRTPERGLKTPQQWIIVPNRVLPAIAG